MSGESYGTTRRSILAGALATISSLAGCQTEQNSPTETSKRNTTNATPDTATSTSTSDQTPPTDTGPDIGATYQLRHGTWGDCMTGRPAGGRYERVTEAVATRHVDAFRTAGIGRVRVRVPSGKKGRKLLGPIKSTTSVAIDLQRDLLRHVPDSSYKSIVADYATLAQNTESVSGLVVSIDDLRRDEGATARTTLREAHGSLPEFVEWLRNQLPGFRLVAQVGMPQPGYFDKFPKYYRETVAAFDAVTNSVWPPEPSETPWEAFHTAQIGTYQSLRAFGREHSIEFEPTVAPGIPTGVRACGGDDARAVPRNSEEYERALRNAVRYSTKGRATIESFNNWRRGTQIEPGTYDGHDYGDSYLSRTRDVKRDPPSDLDRDVYYISPDGTDSGSGSKDDPLRTIQQALNFAQPGDTVHLLPGEYFQDFETVRAGTKGEPIEITGPREAVIRGAGSRQDGIIANIWHSHIHVTGCTFNGLWRPDQPDAPKSYRPYIMFVRSNSSEYNEDVRVLPHAVGNARNSFINFNMTNNVEVGEFEVIGPAGTGYVLGDEVDHEGEIVYIGSPPVQARNLQEEGILTGADTSHGYRVHHIDNSQGYAHSELVNTKPGTYDITIEYCTDGGGGYVTDHATNASVAVAGHDTTVRWNDLQGGPLPGEAELPTHGVSIDAGVPEYCHHDDAPQQCVGFDNAIYGNRIRDFGHSTKKLTGHAVFFEAIYLEEQLGEQPPPNVWPEDQKTICGNDYTGPTHAEPDKSCPDWVPKGNGIGHTGGNSPW